MLVFDANIDSLCICTMCAMPSPPSCERGVFYDVRLVHKIPFCTVNVVSIPVLNHRVSRITLNAYD